MKIEVLSSAYNDLQKGRNFYEKQSSSLGDYFFDSLFADIDSLILYAGVHQKVFGYYRKLSKTFPFAIYYKINKSTVTVWRILDCRQDPNQTTTDLV